MPSPNERRRNNLRMGMFVTVAIALAVAIVLTLSDLSRFVTPQTRYTAIFEVEEGVRFLRAGSEVQIGGLPVGRVQSVELTTRILPVAGDESASPMAQDCLAAEFTIPPDIKLFDQAVIIVSGPLIGAQSWLEIIDTGRDPERAQTPLPPGSEIDAVGGGLLTAMLGPQGNELMDNVTAGSAFFRRIDSEYDQRVAPTLDDLRASAGNVRAITDDVRSMTEDLRHQRYQAWADQVDAIMAWTDGATRQLDDLTATGQSVLTQADEILAENREPIRQSIANVSTGTADAQAILDRVRHETVDRVHRLLDHADDAVASAGTTLDRLATDYDVWSSEVEEALANAALTSQQLKLTAVEVKRNPWKLLYRPDATELEHELLYESARSFAMAAADLRAASTAVNRMLDRHGETLDDPALRERITQSLIEPLDRYENAQRELFEVLKLETATP